jgi:hypothetical protein
LEKIKIALSKNKIESKNFAKVLKEINPERFKLLDENVRKVNKAETELKER